MSRFLPLNFKHPLSAVMLALVALIGTAGALVLSTDSRAADDKKASEPRPALTVSVIQPAKANLAARLPANGNIAAWQEASIGAEAIQELLKLVDLDTFPVPEEHRTITYPVGSVTQPSTLLHLNRRTDPEQEKGEASVSNMPEEL